MHSQNSVSSATTSQIMERMRSLGSFTVAKKEDQSAQVAKRLGLHEVEPTELVDGFFQLIEDGKIRVGEIDASLGSGGSTTSEPVYERQVVYSPAE